MKLIKIGFHTAVSNIPSVRYPFLYPSTALPTNCFPHPLLLFLSLSPHPFSSFPSHLSPYPFLCPTHQSLSPPAAPTPTPSSLFYPPLPSYSPPPAPTLIPPSPALPSHPSPPLLPPSLPFFSAFPSPPSPYPLPSLSSALLSSLKPPF